MQQKRFFAENSMMAFRLVKESLGPEAVIISNRTVPNGVEIIAGDEQFEIASRKDDLENPDAVNEQWNTMLAENKMQESVSRQEIVELKKLMISEFAAVKIGSWESNDKQKYALFQKLVKQGFSISLIAKIVASLDQNIGFDQMLDDVLQEIELSINTGIGFGQSVDEISGIVMLHGMTGSGKTTTIAKIAAQVVAAHGPDSVVMVCADNRRMGAHQQLLGYGKILEVPVLHVRKKTELGEILNALRSKRLVLVDHSGISPTQLSGTEPIHGFDCDLPNTRHYLAISATTQASIVNRLLSSEWKDRLEGVIVTKVDEAVQLGEFISCLIQNRLPTKFLSAGQDVRKDLQQFHADDFVQRAVELGDLQESSTDDKVNEVVKTLLHEKLECLH